MKNIYMISLIILSIFVLSSCAETEKKVITKTISTDQFQVREGIAYEVNSNTPFTGKVEGTIVDEARGIREKKESHYEEGLLNGSSIYYYPNGQKMSEMNYIKGNISGKATQWKNDGSILVEFVVDSKNENPIIQINPSAPNPNMRFYFFQYPSIPIKKILDQFIGGLNSTVNSLGEPMRIEKSKQNGQEYKWNLISFTKETILPVDIFVTISANEVKISYSLSENSGAIDNESVKNLISYGFIDVSVTDKKIWEKRLDNTYCLQAKEFSHSEGSNYNIQTSEGFIIKRIKK